MVTVVQSPSIANPIVAPSDGSRKTKRIGAALSVVTVGEERLNENAAKVEAMMSAASVKAQRQRGVLMGDGSHSMSSPKGAKTAQTPSRGIDEFAMCRSGAPNSDKRGATSHRSVIAALANGEHTSNDASEQGDDNPVEPHWLFALLPVAVRRSHRPESTPRSTSVRDE
jgi:hypothetical protein